MVLMKTITIEHVSKTYGEKTLFHDISFVISEKERVGLIGVNGTGKSSLLKLIAGLDSPDEGNFICSKDYQISYLVTTTRIKFRFNDSRSNFCRRCTDFSFVKKI